MRLTTGGKLLATLFSMAVVALGATGVTWSRKSEAAPTVSSQLAPDPRPQAEAAVRAMEEEVAAIESALEVAVEEGRRHWVSRKDDRDRIADLNNRLINAKTRRADARAALAAISSEAR